MIPLLAICLGYFMTILDVTIVNVALVDIKEQLSATVTGLQWIVDGYALVFASFLLTGGALGDRRGKRTVFFYDSKLDLNWTFSSHGKEGHHPRCASRLALL